MNERAEKKDLSLLHTLMLFALICLIIELYKFIMNILVINMGIGELPYPRLYLQVLPGLYIIHRNYRNLSFKVPHLMAFLLMISVFVLFENYAAQHRSFYPHDYQFVRQQLYIYTFFLMLVNFGLNRTTFYKIIDIVFYSGMLICIISYVGYLGFFKVASFNYFGPSLLESEKPSHILHVDQASYLFSFAFLLLIIKQLNEKKFSFFYRLRDILVILLIFGIIIIASSRGAFLISSVLLFYYIYFFRRFWRIDTALKASVIPVLLAIILILSTSSSVVNNLKTTGAKITLIKRFYQFQSYTTTRMINIQNTWKNFMDHPLTGVGYYKAAKSNYSGTRSNNQYLQLSATVKASPNISS